MFWCGFHIATDRSHALNGIAGLAQRQSGGFVNLRSGSRNSHPAQTSNATCKEISDVLFNIETGPAVLFVLISSAEMMAQHSDMGPFIPDT